MARPVSRTPKPLFSTTRTSPPDQGGAAPRVKPLRDELSTGRGAALRSSAARLGAGGSPGHRGGQKSHLGELQRFFESGERVGAHDQVGGTIQRNPRDAGLNRPEDAKQALALLKQGRAAEAEALSKLTPAEQAAYRKLAKQLQGDPQAQLALRLMLLDGRLTSPQQASNGDTLLGGLVKLSEQPLADGLDGGQLLGQVVRELAVPAGINQGITQTCGAASLQVQLATENPAEYVRLVAGLSSPSGEVTLANGDLLRREPGWDSEESIRSLPSRLLQSAFMEYANGARWNYDPASDRSVGSSLDNRGQSGVGLEASEIARLEQGLFNRPARAVPAVTGETPTEQEIDALLENLPSVVGLRFPEGSGANVPGHAVLVTGVKDGVVTFVNPYGLEVTMPVEQFKEQLLFGVVSG